MECQSSIKSAKVAVHPILPIYRGIPNFRFFLLNYLEIVFFPICTERGFSVFDVKINISIFGEWVDVFAFCNWIINYHHHYNLQLIQFSQQIKWVRASDQIVLISLPLTQTNRNTHFEKEFWQIQIPLQIQLNRSRRQTKALWFPVTAQDY